MNYMSSTVSLLSIFSKKSYLSSRCLSVALLHDPFPVCILYAFEEISPFIICTLCTIFFWIDTNLIEKLPELIRNCHFFSHSVVSQKRENIRDLLYQRIRLVWSEIVISQGPSRISRESENTIYMWRIIVSERHHDCIFVLSSDSLERYR